MRSQWIASFHVGINTYHLHAEPTMGGYVGFVVCESLYFCAVPFSTNVEMLKRAAEKRVREICGFD